MMTKEQLENLRDKLRLRRQAFFPLYEDERYLVDLLAEVDRLTAENERLREAGVGYSQQTVDAITKEREMLRAENERLRAELNNIAVAQPQKWDESVRDQFQEWAQNRARAALEEKP